jgi:mono/diheme cytochrome c family protein
MGEASNQEIFNAIKNGVAGVISQSGEIRPGPLPEESEEDEATGSTLMPYWGFTLSDEEIWSLAAYIRTLHPNEAERIVISDNPGESKKSYPQVTVNVDFNVQGPERERLIGQGRTLYSDKYSCPACHQINGSGGDVGPDLSRAGFRFNSKWVYRWIKYATSIKHETKMPNFAMPDEDALAITLYLGTLK